MAGTPPPRPRRSEVDFADVFGGPPRRSSGHDHLRRGSADLWCALPRTRSSSGGAPGERPVFGERTSSDRRRQPGNEFYNDIFPGSESACPSPRPVSAGDWDVFGDPASPGSMSRSRSSFSLKFTIGMDNSMPTSPSQHAANRNNDGTSYAYSVPSSPNSSTNSFLARGLPSQHSMRNPFSFHRFPFQSRLRSQCGDKKNATNYVSSMDSECEGTPVSLESYINNKFHFSFYKWARKGASLMLPATAQEKGAKVVRLRSFPQVVVQGIDFIDDEDNMSTATGASKSQTDYKDRKSVTKHGADDAKANVITASPSTQSSQSPSGQKSHGNRIKGKVKDFIKMFNPEGSPKCKGTPESQDQISSGKYGSKGGGQDFVSISSSEANEDVKSAQTNYENTFSTAASPINEAQEKEAPVLKVDSEMQESTEKFSENKATTTASSDESTHDVSKDKASNTIDGEESHVEDLEACVVEHFSEEQYSVLHNDQEKDQIKISESKICEWSKGKQGNIRSLLSTLQYVLWPESGWKPVPLVDIIEGAAVKKAYQRALLCLHPDKLQQRGAAVHHKYIAAKVFDILQEAWAEFNSVTFG